MVRHGWKSVPVVSGGRLAGVVSRSSVIRALARPDSVVRRELRSVLCELGHEDWDVDVASGVARISGPVRAVDSDVAHATASSVLGVRRVRVIAQTSGAGAVEASRDGS
jgi:CBS domain-containing protein